MMRSLAPVLALALVACNGSDPEPVPVVAGALQAGAAQDTLDLPLGTPMGGFSARARYLTGLSRQDRRQSPYVVGFVPSVGMQTRPQVKVIWLENGEDHLVLMKGDLIYSNDNFVTKVTEQLEAATGEELEGRVTFAANHSHNSWGPWVDQSHFYLGGDKFNQEIFERMQAEVDFETTVVATGGLAPLISKESRAIEHVDEMLTLDGLRLLNALNS